MFSISPLSADIPRYKGKPIAKLEINTIETLFLNSFLLPSDHVAAICGSALLPNIAVNAGISMNIVHERPV